jgi:hypothetical protein
MAKRIVVLYLAIPSVAVPNPHEHLVYRGCANNFQKMWSKCVKTLPVDLMRQNGSGHIFIGCEGDSWIENPKRNSDEAIAWNGVAKSGQFQDFLRIRTEHLFMGDDGVETPAASGELVSA